MPFAALGAGMLALGVGVYAYFMTRPLMPPPPATVSAPISPSAPAPSEPENVQKPDAPAPKPAPTAPPPSNPPDPSWKRYHDSKTGYSIRVPSNWRISTTTKGDFWRVTFSSETGVSAMVEVQSNAPRASAINNWRDLDRRFRKSKRGYQLISLNDNGVLGGEKVATWSFLLPNDEGVLMQKTDYGIWRNGKGYALLLAAPDEKYESYRAVFEEIRYSFEF